MLALASMVCVVIVVAIDGRLWLRLRQMISGGGSVAVAVRLRQVVASAG